MRECLLEVCEFHIECEALNHCHAADLSGLTIDQSHQNHDPKKGAVNTFPGFIKAKRDIPPLGPDMVVLPQHYARFAIEPINFVATNGLDFLTGNAIKYLCRAPYKHGDSGKQDYMKAIRYTMMVAKKALGDPEWWKPYRNDLDAKLLEELSYGTTP